MLLENQIERQVGKIIKEENNFFINFFKKDLKK